MLFSIVNETTDLEITHDVLVRIAEALSVQSTRDVSGWYEVTPDSFAVVDSIGEVLPQSSVFHLVDSIPEAPDALAYHSINNHNRPVLRLGWKTILGAGGTAFVGSVSLSCAMSHEAIETKVNPYVDLWADMPDGVREVCREACDPVEADVYTLNGVAVSNFVGSRWFSEGEGPYDFLGVLKKPFTMSRNGYMIVREGGPAGATSQVFGENVGEAKRALVRKYGRVAHHHTRRGRSPFVAAAQGLVSPSGEPLATAPGAPSAQPTPNALVTGVGTTEEVAYKPIIAIVGC